MYDKLLKRRVKSQIRTLLLNTGCARTKYIVSIIHGLGLERLFM